jgi:hypothetical protein
MDTWAEDVFWQLAKIALLILSIVLAYGIEDKTSARRKDRSRPL